MGQGLQIIERAGDGTIQGALGLTEHQRTVMLAFAENGTVSGAAKIVGCSAPSVSGILRLAHVQAALHDECRSLLARAIPLALGVLLNIVKDEDIAKTRLGLDAAKAILDRAGFMPQKPSEASQGDKRDLSDLSLDELAAFIRQGQERQRQAGAVDEEGTISVPDTDQEAQNRGSNSGAGLTLASG